MWIFTKQGFLSIKQHNDDPEKLLIRARVNGDLQKIFPGCKVIANTGTDYKYRTTVNRSAAAAVTQRLANILFQNLLRGVMDQHCHFVVCSVGRNCPHDRTAFTPCGPRCNSAASGLASPKRACSAKSIATMACSPWRIGRI